MSFGLKQIALAGLATLVIGTSAQATDVNVTIHAGGYGAPQRIADYSGEFWNTASTAIVMNATNVAVLPAPSNAMYRNGVMGAPTDTDITRSPSGGGPSLPSRTEATARRAGSS
ncbi:hypothetical protein ACFQY9_10445 [Microvirga aerilata]|uniref:hypothetical protein n=1 Tax=Microvirga aerilata TaxID=670292 RepID=UPI0036322EC1